MVEDYNVRSQQNRNIFNSNPIIGMRKQEDGAGEFQSMTEQVETYVLLQPPSPQSKIPRKSGKHKNSERHKLQLLQALPDQNFPAIDLKEVNRIIKRLDAGGGRVIPIGSMVFRSNFECGNLADVKQVGQNVYEIQLEKQTNSNRQSAWFYFSVEGAKGQIHFVIKGFTKSSSLYNQGMKVCYRDTRELTKWRRGGSRITYTNSIENDQYKSTYQLRFSHFFKNTEQTCIQFAYCFPYSLRKLYHLITVIKQSISLHSLGKTYNGLQMPLITIGNKLSKEIIVLSARVHPGETVSSFIMEGFLRQLVGDNQYGKMLRSKYLFKIVPMSNPDGVVKGNYRFSAYGCDLNRKWKVCKENFQPQIFYLKNLIKSLNRERKVIMFIDMHGHSRRKNVFFYGCCQKKQGQILNTKPKQFPFLMEKLHDAFKYQYCCFNIQKDKEGTARVSVWKELKIDYVYTLQSSFCGPQFGVNYLESDYEKIGKKLCEGIAVFFYEAEKQVTHQYKSIEKMSVIKQKAISQLLNDPTLLEVGDRDDSGSDSDPQNGQIPDKDRNTQTGLPLPELLGLESKNQLKVKKLNISKKFLSQSSFKERKTDKMKSQISLRQEFKGKQTEKNELFQKTFHNTPIRISNTPQTNKFEVKIANSLNTFELQSLKASALYQKNVRVHSFTKNAGKTTSRSKKINQVSNVVVQQPQQQKSVRITLMHGHEGAQYRRVRKLAEQNLKKQLSLQAHEEAGVVKEVSGNQLVIGQSQMNKKVSTITPRFYPTSHQRYRRTSADGYLRKISKHDQLKKISINGDEIGYHCKGKQIYL